MRKQRVEADMLTTFSKYLEWEKEFKPRASQKEITVCHFTFALFLLYPKWQDGTERFLIAGPRAGEWRASFFDERGFHIRLEAWKDKHGRDELTCSSFFGVPENFVTAFQEKELVKNPYEDAPDLFVLSERGQKVLFENIKY